MNWLASRPIGELVYSHSGPFDENGQCHIAGDAEQDNGGELDAVPEHDCDEDHRKHHIQYDGQRLAGQKAADALQLANAGY